MIRGSLAPNCWIFNTPKSLLANHILPGIGHN